MFLREKLDQRRVVKNKIAELESVLHNKCGCISESINSIVELLLNCIEELQTLNLIIHNANNQYKIIVGSSKVSLSTAIEIRDTINKKMSILTDLISGNNDLDIIDLLSKRDVLLEEYNGINRLIRLADWSVQVD